MGDVSHQTPTNQNNIIFFFKIWFLLFWFVVIFQIVLMLEKKYLSMNKPGKNKNNVECDVGTYKSPILQEESKQDQIQIQIQPQTQTQIQTQT